MPQDTELSEYGDAPGQRERENKLHIGLFVAFVVLFAVNIITGAPPAVTDPVDLGIEGKYFYANHGTVSETTLGKYIWSWIIFPSGIALFIVLFLLAIYRQATGRYKPAGQRAQRIVKWIVAFGFVGIITFAGITIYRAHKEQATYPNPAATAGEFVRNVRGSTEIFHDENGRYATTADELVKTGTFHPSGVTLLNGEADFHGYTFTYASDGKSYECIGQPPRTASEAYVYFVSSDSSYFFCLFQNTDLDKVRQGIKKLKE